jgi:hypothetical protein
MRDQDGEDEGEEGPPLQDPAKTDCNAEKDKEAVEPQQLYHDACDDDTAAGSDLVHDGGGNGAQSKYRAAREKQMGPASPQDPP